VHSVRFTVVTPRAIVTLEAEREGLAIVGAITESIHPDLSVLRDYWLRVDGEVVAVATRPVLPSTRWRLHLQVVIVDWALRAHPGKRVKPGPELNYSHVSEGLVVLRLGDVL